MPVLLPSPSIVDDFEPLGAPYGRRRWRSDGGRRIYEWDGLHGELEMYNSRGRHLGALDPRTGVLIKDAVKGRRIDVR